MFMFNVPAFFKDFRSVDECGCLKQTEMACDPGWNLTELNSFKYMALTSVVSHLV